MTKKCPPSPSRPAKVNKLNRAKPKAKAHPQDLATDLMQAAPAPIKKPLTTEDKAGTAIAVPPAPPAPAPQSDETTHPATAASGGAAALSTPG